LHYRPPFDAETLLAYLKSEAIVGVEQVSNGRYRRTIAFPRSKGIIELEPTSKNAVRVHLQLDSLNDISLVVQRCRHLFDLDADSAEIDSVLATDSLLAPLVAARSGRRVPGTMNGFELAVRAIVRQHVPANEVGNVLHRLVTTLGEALDTPQQTLTHFFPSSQQIVHADLQVSGLPPTCSEALHTLAQAVAQGEMVLERDADREKTMAQLLAIPGVNQRTATCIAMRALGDPDAFVVADVQHVFAQHGIDVEGIAERVEQWRPWRAYGVNYL
jgi:AraC family transcriptional regulator of adaptative response / DNA-3-methyladenine glycosylase II